jgi:hypothetical protein
VLRDGIGYKNIYFSQQPFLATKALVAATMHACILCNQHDRALDVFRTLVEGNFPFLSEFYPGGEENQIKPLCRDLAMRACGNSTHEGSSVQAMTLLRQALEGGITVSAEALFGVLGACEHDKNWMDAVDVLLKCLNDGNNIWLVAGSALQIPTIEDLLEKSSPATSKLDRETILSLVMRTCNAANQCGVSLLCLMLAENSPTGSLMYNHDKIALSVDYPNFVGPVEQTILPFFAGLSNVDELLSATMVALSGVHCSEQGRSLFRAIKATHGDVSGFVDSGCIDKYLDAHSDKSSADDQRLWCTAHRHIHRICTAMKAIRIKGEVLDREQRKLLSSALASTLSSTTSAGQPAAGILLGEYMQSELLGLAEMSSGRTSLFKWPTRSNSENGLVLTDPLLAGKMKALQATNRDSEALSLFDSAVGNDGVATSNWPQSCHVAIDLLAQNGDHERVAELLPRLVKCSNSIEAFVATGRACAKAGHWKDVADIYHIALEKGCLSTELAVLAMKAVVETNIQGRLKILRGIIHDAGRSVGQSPVTWLEQNYWRIKNFLGFSHTRLLMWWNDPDTSHLDELQFALDIFEDRLGKGLEAKSETIRIIVANARAFKGEIPTEKKEITRVPRDGRSWIELLHRVRTESDTLMNDASYIDDFAMALLNLGCYQECVAFVKDSLEGEIRLRQNTLMVGLHAAEAAGMLQEAGNIELALFHESDIE